MTKRHLMIATRESPLAICQAEFIKSALVAHYPHLSIELLGVTTQADKHLDVTLTTIGGKGLFVRELEDALLDMRADIAVHSMKDVPMALPPGLCLPVMTERIEVRDVFLSNQYVSFAQLSRSALVGTASLRRQTQLKAIRSDIELRNLRGNINTRIKRLDQGDFDAIILAGAGIKRMNLDSRIRSYFSVEQILPAAGQGALGIECREQDEHIKEIIAPFNHAITNACVSAERAFCQRLGGGCQLPIAAYAEIHHDVLTLRGLVASRDGIRILRAQRQGANTHAENIGIRVAEELLQQGAEKILKEFLGS
ncbi:MAG TPA: hydroxymethylbilane synthase [Gammaproteobacteria bacterium]|nr:hydroxymethylbilane synthase [Gammaproteobacteria bacterium]